MIDSSRLCTIGKVKILCTWMTMTGRRNEEMCIFSRFNITLLLYMYIYMRVVSFGIIHVMTYLSGHLVYWFHCGWKIHELSYRFFPQVRLHGVRCVSVPLDPSGMSRSCVMPVKYNPSSTYIEHQGKRKVSSYLQSNSWRLGKPMVLSNCLSCIPFNVAIRKLLPCLTSRSQAGYRHLQAVMGHYEQYLGVIPNSGTSKNDRGYPSNNAKHMFNNPIWCACCTLA